MKLMMSKLLFPMLLLACGQQAMGLAPASPPTAAEMPPTLGPASMDAIGFHDSVDWHCHQEDQNENLIWIECKFDNTSSNTANEACIKIILTDLNGNEVDRSRLVCSGPMQPGTSAENYAGFENTKHNFRRSDIAFRCHQDTSLCKMTTKEFPRE